MARTPKMRSKIYSQSFSFSALGAACHLIVAFLLVGGSYAGHTLSTAASCPLLLRSTPLTREVMHHPTVGIRRVLDHPSSRPTGLLRSGQFSAAAFLHRAWPSRKAIAGLSDANVRDESSTTPSQNIQSGAISIPNSLGSVLSIRGGASSSNIAVQNLLKSILSSPSLPYAIKRLIEMICRFIENLTGFKVLPHVEKEKKSKSKKTNLREEEVLLEEASLGAKKKRRPKRPQDLEEVKMAVAQKKKTRTSPEEVETSALESTGIEMTAPKKPPTATTTTPPPPTTTTTTKATLQTKDPKPKRPDAASQKFLSNKIKSSNPNYRIQRELKEFLSSPPPGLSVKISGKNVRLWIVTLSMPDNTIYAGETYRLRIQFPNDYPTSPPSVYFLPPTPRHEHVYTNGDICLSLLGKDWRPIMTAQSIAQAIMSILCGAQRKSLPMDNARHAGNKPGQKQDDWVYHDDNC